jgi:hypothetical protein
LDPYQIGQNLAKEDDCSKESLIVLLTNGEGWIAEGWTAEQWRLKRGEGSSGWGQLHEL